MKYLERHCQRRFHALQQSNEIYGDIPGPDELHLQRATPIMFPPYLMLGVTGYDGSLTFTSGYCREGVGNDSVERMLDQVLMELS